MIISSLKSKKSKGHDDLNSILIKNIGSAISIPLTIAINKSFTLAEVPLTLKFAKVLPIFKSKEIDQLSNYIPISTLTTFSKIIEKLMHKRLSSFVKDILYESQYGFREHRSTINSITELVINIINGFDNKESTLSTFIDLSKAFDTIDHKILLSKLEYYGIRGVALDWFRNYLTGRKQFVNFNGVKSHTCTLSYGVPQGSVLGPLLFIIYTNDFQNCLLNTKCIMFADDTTIYGTGSDIETLYSNMNDDLDCLDAWFKANKLSLNVGKTRYILFNNNRKENTDEEDTEPLTLQINRLIIEKTTSMKFLGLIIDEKLNWSEHIKNTINKISKSLYIINTTKNLVPQKLKVTLYYSMIYSYINYGVLLWGNTYQYNKNNILKLQKRAVWCIKNTSYNAHTDPLFSELNILKFEQVVKLDTLKFMYKVVNDMLPKNIQNKFILNEKIHIYNTRQKLDVHIHSTNTQIAHNSLVSHGPELWSKLDISLKNLPSMQSFKRKLKQYLNDNQ